jgi:4'-phosphopantetheinyl transferase EntD
VLANLSGFDGSPESMRNWQLEYGAEIGRAVVNFKGPIVFCVVSRYHGGAFVVFSNALHDNMEVAALEGTYASVIGGAPAAAVVFAREVVKRTRKDPRIVELEKAIADPEHADKARLRVQLEEMMEAVHSEKLGEVAEEFDRIHSVQRAQQVGSVHRILPPAELRPYLIDAVERGMAKEGGVRWLLAGESEIPPDDDWLTPTERGHLAAFRFPPRRASWRLGRWAAKKAISACLGAPLESLEILAALDGAPEAFVNGEPAPAVLSLTHRDALAACAVAPSGTALGCDLERVEPRSEAFVRDYFTAAEKAWTESAPDPAFGANLIWSAKESALKALREGLRLDTWSVEVRFPEEEPVEGWSPLEVHYAATGRTFHGWWRREGDCVLTLAAEPAPGLPVRLSGR